MRVLSAFDGISCGRVALDRIGIKPSIYFASEIDKTAMRVSARNWPDIAQFGCVRTVADYAEAGMLGTIDLLLGGSPCQGFSRAGDELNFSDPRSALFFEFVRLKNAVKPKHFLLENVDMKKEWRDIISAFLGVEPIMINSSDFSGQQRKRWYWSNIPVKPWIDRNIKFWSIREYAGDHLKAYKLNRTPSRIAMWADGKGKGNSYGCKNITFADKASCLTIKQDRFGNAGLIEFEDFCRYLTEIECERLQTLPDNYTHGEARTTRYRHLGNGWTVDVIAHILEGIL